MSLSHSPGSTHAGPARFEAWLFALLVALMVLPVWAVEYFPSQDGPVHLYVLHVWQRFDLPDFEAFRQHFERNYSLEPNLGFYLLAYPLVLWFGAATAEKLFVTFVAVLFCYGGRWTMRRISGEATLLSLLLIPFCFHYFMHKGFYSFCLGVALFLPAFGLALARLERARMGDLALIGLLALLLVLAHLMAFVLLALALGLVLLGRLALAAWEDRARLRLLLAQCLGLGLAFLPALLVVWAFLGRHGVSGSAPMSSMARELRKLASLSAQVSFDPIELAYLAPIAVLLLLLGALTAHAQWRDGSWRHFLPLALVPVGLAVVCFLPVLTTKEVAVGERVQLVLPITLLFWLATGSHGPRLRRAVVAVALVGVLGSTSYRLWQYERINEDLREYRAAAALIGHGETVLQLRYETGHVSPLGRHLLWERSEALAHAGALLALERDAVFLSASLMSTIRYGYFPVVYRRVMDPFHHVGVTTATSVTPFDFAGYEASTGRSVDHVLLFGLDGLIRRFPADAPAVLAAIERKFSPPYPSPGGRVIAFRRASGALAEDGTAADQPAGAEPAGADL